MGDQGEDGEGGNGADQAEHEAAVVAGDEGIAGGDVGIP